MSTQTAATRSVVIGLLLAALSAGSLIAFSLFAGEADNPLGTSVVATRPDSEVEELVLGKRIARGPVPRSTPVVPAASATELRIAATGETFTTTTTTDAVLGKRLRNGGGNEAPDGKHRSRNDGDDRKAIQNDKRKDKRGKRKEADNGPTTARVARTSSCGCKDRGDNTPNGHAYGHHKARSGDSSPGLARGHSKGNAKGKKKN